MEIQSQVLVFPEGEMSSAVTDSGGGVLRREVL